MQIAVIAGGLATRMYPLTERMPKSLLILHGRPFVDYQLDLFKNGGIDDVVFCVGHLGNMIEAHVGDGTKWGLKVKYSYEGDELLGTGGALKKAIGLLEENFFLTWGDSFVRADYSSILKKHAESKYLCNIGIYRNRNLWDTSNVEFADGRVVRYAKGDSTTGLEYIDAGLSVFRAEFLKLLPDGRTALETMWQTLAANGTLGGIEIPERFYEIGSFEGLKEFEKFSKQSFGHRS